MPRAANGRGAAPPDRPRSGPHGLNGIQVTSGKHVNLLLQEAGGRWSRIIPIVHPSSIASHQKVAIVLQALPREVADRLIRELGAEQSEAVALEFNQAGSISDEVRQRVLGEFLDHALQGRERLGQATAQATLDQLARTSPTALAAILQQLWLSGQEAPRRRAQRSRLSPGWVLMGLGLAGVAAGLAGFPIAVAQRKERRSRALPVEVDRRDGGKPGYRAGVSPGRGKERLPAEQTAPPAPEPPPHSEPSERGLAELPESRQPIAALPPPAESRPLRIEPLLVEVSEATYTPLKPQIDSCMVNYKGIITRLKELGLVSPEVPVRKTAELAGPEYRIAIRSKEVARGSLKMGQRLALGSSSALHRLDPNGRIDYAHGLPGLWIHPRLSRRAERAGCLVLWPAEVLAWHLNRVITSYGPELMDTQEVYNLVSRARPAETGGIKSVVPELITMAELKAFLHRLWRTKGSVGELSPLLKVISDSEERDPEKLVDLVLQGGSVYSGPIVSEHEIPASAALAVLHRIHHWDINNVMEQLKPEEASLLAQGFVRVRSLSPEKVKSLWDRLQSQRLFWTNQKRFVQWLQQFLKDGSRAELSLGPRRRLALLLTLLPVEVAETVSQLVLNRIPSARAKQVIAELGKLTAYQLLEKPADPVSAQLRERVAGEFLAGLKDQFLKDEVQVPAELAQAECQRLAHGDPSTCASFISRRWLGEKDAVTRYQEMARTFPRRTAMLLCASNADAVYLSGPEKAVTFMQSLGPETAAEVEKWLMAHGVTLPWALPRPAYRYHVAREFVAGFYSEGGAPVDGR
ncbi:MAG: FHIPEP family type III secretion protein [Candidatus Eremiobacterota bacterium]